MKRPECKAAIPTLAREWAGTQNQPVGWHPSFSEFVNWLKQNGQGHYLDFRSRMGSLYDAEQWFDDALNQKWRN
ncbi:hypothetical protein TU86_18390 [Pseudomonas weihenstephanensis]|uniref:Uncharacterized protein n=1 Tax=Pseudomonas weihenstephanensis TaxID=1608994 RepID=A0A0J6IJ99_9PSED|nr:hypothetical protein [Pseudomonas weihenstephanensis]KMN12232.1 hypothetical protein TU86_18390 [Pseudomonas weihenstephanensis]